MKQAVLDFSPPRIQQREYLVDGVLRQWDGPLLDIRSPLNEDGTFEPSVIGQVPDLDAEAGLQALAAARAAYDNGRGPWPTMPVGERIERLAALAESIAEKRQEIIRLLMWEIGKPLLEAGREIDRTIACISDSIEALKQLDRASSRLVTEEGIIGQIRRAPLGVVLCMGPYNFPLYETFTNLVPALLMGNTAIIKPPRFGVLLFQPLLNAFCDLFPPGVINVIYGTSEVIVPPLLASGGIDVLAFIGTGSVSDSLRALHPHPHRLRCILGLDAKNPAIVLADADLDLAAREIVSGSLKFNGQRCTALKIVFVHRSVARRFISHVSRRTRALVCGSPWDRNVSITPLPEPDKPAYLAGLVADAAAKGAQVVNQGGAAIEGTLFSPALLYPVTPHMRIYHEEQFGPVVPFVPYDDVREVIDYIVASPYGQQASIFSRSAEAVAQVMDALVHQVCRININCQCQRGPDTFPFNGRKHSAEGTQSVIDALRIFSIRTVVASLDTTLDKKLIQTIITGRKSHFLSTDYLL